METEKQALLLFREAEIYREELIQYRKERKLYVNDDITEDKEEM